VTIFISCMDVHLHLMHLFYIRFLSMKFTLVTIKPQMMTNSIVENELTFLILKSIITDFWENEIPPIEWETGLLKVLPKSLPGNYRGIMLLGTSYKITAIVLNNHMCSIAEGLDHEALCGFRPE